MKRARTTTKTVASAPTETVAEPPPPPDLPSVPPLPALARELGFTQDPCPTAMFGKYTKVSGPKNPNAKLSPLQALRLFVNDDLATRFSESAAKVSSENQWSDETSVLAFWKYFAAVLGHGIVQYAEERHAYVAEKSSVAGLLSNSFLRDLHTFEEWQHAKQLFAVSHIDLSSHFNQRASDLIQPAQKIAVDEGGLPSWANSEYRKYTPGKPHPNSIEYLVAVDENFFCFNIIWPQDMTAKYDDPEKKLDQMRSYVTYFTEYDKQQLTRSKQPYIFYIDSRWSSLKLLELLHENQLFGVLSCGENMRPKTLWPWIKTDLKKYDWWSIGVPRLSANLVCIRTKDKVYLKILTNYCALKEIQYLKRKRKFPMTQFYVPACDVQKEYNAFKCKVDQLNKAVLEYFRLSRYLDDKVTFTQFFIHLFTVQSWTYYNACTGRSLSQLEYRLLLLQELAAQLVPPAPAQALILCWPVSRAPEKSRCAYGQCRNVTTLFCKGCGKWGCGKCLEKHHLNYAKNE